MVETILVFLNVVMLHINIRGMKHTTICTPAFAFTHTFDHWDRVKNVKTFFLPEGGHVAYQIKDNEA